MQLSNYWNIHVKLGSRNLKSSALPFWHERLNNCYLANEEWFIWWGYSRIKRFQNWFEGKFAETPNQFEWKNHLIQRVACPITSTSKKQFSLRTRIMLHQCPKLKKHQKCTGEVNTWMGPIAYEITICLGELPSYQLYQLWLVGCHPGTKVTKITDIITGWNIPN